ncbi:MAG: proton-conducting transporter membrane subunit, partial [Acidimicrobiia bacterium]
MDFPVISLLVALPLLAALVVVFIPGTRRELLLPVAFGLTLLPLAVALFMLWEFETGVAGFQFTEQALDFEAWGVGWRVGVDGISILLIVLTTILFPISLMASTSITQRPKAYLVSLLILEAGLLGVFVTLDLVLFFVFFEITLVPMYMLIGIWGSGNRVYAAMKFVLYTA